MYTLLLLLFVPVALEVPKNSYNAKDQCKIRTNGGGLGASYSLVLQHQGEA